ncbi:MAG: DUF167 domain-containing protein [Deltaproteobacteria bacterium]
MLFIQKHSRGIVFKVFLQPRSSKNMIVGLHGDTLKLKVTAPPVEGAANKMCVKFLAKLLSVPSSSLEIISGHGSRTKKILLKSKQTPPSSSESGHLEQKIKRLI